MKRFIVIIGVLIMSILFITSCKPREKCPAYGHPTYQAIPEIDNTQLR